MENSQSQQASTTPSVATSNVRKQHYTNDDVEVVRSTIRKGDVWSNYDMCVMKDGNVKARCRKCGHFYGTGSNSTLRNHIGSCKAGQNTSSQATIGADGQVFIYDADAVRLDFTKFVIQQGLPFNHFDNVKLTEIIKRILGPHHMTEREIQYPVLSAMARDLLAVQASTVASESAFSVSGRIISDRRTRLTCESVEVYVCLKDYLDGVDRIQHESSLDDPIIDEDVEEGIIREEEEAGISPSSSTTNTEGELDEGEFEEFEVEDLDVQDFLEENDLDDDLSD